MFRISHLDRKINVEVLEMAKAQQTLLRTIQERKGKTKTTDGRKDRRDKTQRKAEKDLDK